MSYLSTADYDSHWKCAVALLKLKNKTVEMTATILHYKSYQMPGSFFDFYIMEDTLYTQSIEILCILNAFYTII